MEDRSSKLEDRSSSLEDNIGGTQYISIPPIWRIVPPVWRIILEELSLYLFLSSSKIKLEWLGLIGWGLIGDLKMIFDISVSF